MITINDKHRCCGCSACVQVCPKQCISFDEDEMGFRYPLVDTSKCVDCGLCEKVCPFLHIGEPRKPIKVYAAINPNEEIRMKSSSGGIFSLLAESVIDEGGVVFGARFNDQWEVVHDYTENKEGLAQFRASKYVQSIIGVNYRKAKEFLLAGKKVLFTGTPCQIAGLKHFLGKEYDNLLTVDLICHGVPSPLVWRRYLNLITENNSAICHINFRDKSNGWSDFRLKITNASHSILVNESFKTNLYMQMFLRNLSLRMSCFDCRCKSGISGSDLTIADFWGVPENLGISQDNKGVSMILINSGKGVYLTESLKLKKECKDHRFIKNKNILYYRSCKEYPKHNDLFWRYFLSGDYDKVQEILLRFRSGIFNKFKRFFRELV